MLIYFQHKLILAGLILTAVAVFGGPLDIRVEEQQLANGLTILVTPLANTAVMYFQVTIRSGSRNEPEPGQTGFAHFFEHIMFRGSKHFSRAERVRIIQQYGGDANAWTAEDLTSYHIKATAAALEPVIQMEADRFINLQYSKEDFQTESGAILGEYNTNRSSPELPMEEKLYGAAFQHHTYGHTTMGYYPDILAMPKLYKHSLDFFSRYYRPDNAILIVTGDVDPKKVFTLAEKYFGPWRKGYNPKPIPTEPPQQARREVSVTWPTSTQPQLWLAWKVPAYSDTSSVFPALEVLREWYLGQEGTLYKKLVRNDQVVRSLSTDLGRHRDPGLFVVKARLYHEQDLPGVRSQIDSTLSLSMAKLTTTDLSRIKDHLKYAARMRLDTPSGVANQLNAFAQLTGNYRSYAQYHDRLDQLDLKTIQAVQKMIFRPEKLTLATLRQGVMQ